jgi:hypothetical protein
VEWCAGRTCNETGLRLKHRGELSSCPWFTRFTFGNGVQEEPATCSLGGCMKHSNVNSSRLHKDSRCGMVSGESPERGLSASMKYRHVNGAGRRPG